MSRFSLIKKIKNISVLRVSIAFLVYSLLRIIFFTYRLRVENNFSQKQLQELFRQGIFYFWHQNIIGGSFFFFKNKLKGHCVVSPSKDGKMMGFVAEKLGFTVLYGSAHKRTLGLVKDSLEVLEKHKRIALIGDGSRGPAFELQKGIMFLAAKSQLPLIFIECKASNFFVFKKSWDKFQFPLPFSKISVKVHSPVMVTEKDYRNF